MNTQLVVPLALIQLKLKTKQINVFLFIHPPLLLIMRIFKRHLLNIKYNQGQLGYLCDGDSVVIEVHSI